MYRRSCVRAGTGRPAPRPARAPPRTAGGRAPAGRRRPPRSRPRCAGRRPSGGRVPRSEYGEIVVLAPVFCDQSRKTLPAAPGLGHLRQHQLRVLLLELLGDRLAPSRAPRRRSCWPGSAAYRCRPLLPLVTGRQSQARPAPAGRAPAAPPARTPPVPRRSPGSRSITSRSGFFGRPLFADRPLVHVQLERGEVDQVGQRSPARR